MECFAITDKFITHADEIEAECFREENRSGNFPIGIWNEVKIYLFRSRNFSMEIIILGLCRELSDR